MTAGNQRDRHTRLLAQRHQLRLLPRRITPPALHTRYHLDAFHLGHSFALGSCLGLISYYQGVRSKWGLLQEDQNRTWYRLYRAHCTEPAVSDAHRHFLLTRDLSSVTLLMFPVMPVVIHLAKSNGDIVALHAVALIAIFLLLATVARHYGVALVANVLAVASTENADAGKL